MATLKVVVHEARDLPVMNRASGLADPYVNLKLDDMEHTTEIAWHTRHPVWGRDFRFDVPDLFVLQEDPLEVRVYDHDIISRDDIIGIILFDCNTVLYRSSPTISGWFPLHDTRGGIHGDIRMTISVKFHAADNPLAPCVPERYVHRLFVGGGGGGAEGGAGDATALASSFPMMLGSGSVDKDNLHSHHRQQRRLQRQDKNKRRHSKESSIATATAKASISGLGDPMTGNSIAGQPQQEQQPQHGPDAAPEGLASSAASGNASGIHNASAPAAAVPSAPALPLLVEQDLAPVQAARAQHPTLAAEEEGVFIFSVWRLDPAVFRVESTQTMVEELIVKADPEHSRLTTLRSNRSTNEARLLQLFKLSGKVRRQLARKVVELGCNAVLGYAEEFDMEQSCIVVRAYGTPCVLSVVRYVDSSLGSLLRTSSQLLATSTAGSAGFSAVAQKALRLTNSPQHTTHGIPTTGVEGGWASTMALPPSVAYPVDSNNNVTSGPASPAASHALSALASSFPLSGSGDNHPPQHHLTVDARPYIVVDGGSGTPSPASSPKTLMGGSNSTAHPHLSLQYADTIAYAAAAAAAAAVVANTSINTPLSGPSPALKAVDSLAGGGTFGVQNAGELQVAQPLPSSSPGLPQSLQQQQVPRATVLILTVKDLPSGCIQHIGGHICARSVKIVSKVKSKQMVSQERDAWWMELREELRANARAFHCNAILGYEEETDYHEDVVVLSLYGTAVMLDPTLVSLRAGPDFAYKRACERVETRRNCSLLHLYNGSHRRAALASDVGEFIHFSMCGLCHRHPVPEVLLASCAIPVDVTCEGPSPRLVQVTVSKYKRDVRGVDLAVAISQALPYIEFALHRQLLFHLRLFGMNACLCIRVSVVVGPNSIIGTLSGTACRLAGLPIPTLPRVQVVDAAIAHKDTVVRLKDVIAKRRRIKKRGFNNNNNNMASASGSNPQSPSRGSGTATSSNRSSSTNSSSSSSSTSSSASLPESSPPTTSRGKQQQRSRARGHRRKRRTPTTNSPSSPSFSQSARSGSSPSTSSISTSLSRSRRSCPSGHSWLSSAKSDSEEEDDAIYQTADVAMNAGRSKVADYVVMVDDEEEADMMRGMAGDTTFEDSILLTVPYVPDECTAIFDRQDRVMLNRRFVFSSGGVVSDRIYCGGLGVGGAVGDGVGGVVGVGGGARGPCSMAGSGLDGDGSLYTNLMGGDGGSGPPRITTRQLNDCLADAKRAFVQRVCRIAQGHDPTPEVVKVFDFRVVFFLKPNSSDLHLRLEGSLMLSTAQGRRRMERLRGASFHECLRHSVESLPSSVQPLARGNMAGSQNRGNATAGGGGLANAASGSFNSVVAAAAAVRSFGSASADERAILSLLPSFPESSLVAAAVAAAAAAAAAAATSQQQQAQASSIVTPGHRCQHQHNNNYHPRRRHSQQQHCTNKHGHTQGNNESASYERGGSEGVHSNQQQRHSTTSSSMRSSVCGPGRDEGSFASKGPQQQQQILLPADSTMLTAGSAFEERRLSLHGSPLTNTSGLTTAAAAAGTGTSLPYSSFYITGGAAAAPSAAAVSAFHDTHQLVYKFFCQLFTNINAPFPLPYVLDYSMPPLKQWASGGSSGAGGLDGGENRDGEGEGVRADDDGAGGIGGGGGGVGRFSDSRTDYVTSYTDYCKKRSSRTGAVSRNIRVFFSSVGNSLRGLMGKASGAGGGAGGGGSGRRDNLSFSGATYAGSGLHSTFDMSRKNGGGDGGLRDAAAGAAMADLLLHQPIHRLPSDLDALTDENIMSPPVVVTSLDYVAGQGVVRYLGRLSQHFIRDANDVETGDQLGAFFLKTEVEVHCCVLALVRLMGGNALLKHRVTYHEMCDMDGSGGAFIFATVTGDVVQTTGSVLGEMQPFEKRIGCGSGSGIASSSNNNCSSSGSSTVAPGNLATGPVGAMTLWQQQLCNHGLSGAQRERRGGGGTGAGKDARRRKRSGRAGGERAEVNRKGKMDDHEEDTRVPPSSSSSTSSAASSSTSSRSISARR